MAGGYTGKCCIEDLGTGKTEIIEPEDGFYRKYLSGCGLGAAVIMVRQKAGTDPLSPRSYLYAGLSGVMKNFPDIGR